MTKTSTNTTKITVSRHAELMDNINRDLGVIHHMGGQATSEARRLRARLMAAFNDPAAAQELARATANSRRSLCAIASQGVARGRK